MRAILRILATSAALIAVAQAPAFGWGAVGHYQIGSLADRMLVEHPNALAHVKELLGPVALAKAAPWADCLRGVRKTNESLAYPVRGDFRECADFETEGGIVQMIDFARRNWSGCDDRPACHLEYHFVNLAFQRAAYADGVSGTHAYDIVHALTAAIATLQDKPVAAPFRFTKREALMLLVHYMGDVHQPLHVGQVYLDKGGQIGDPDAGTPGFLSVFGANSLVWNLYKEKPNNLHSEWDGVVAGDYSLADARRVPSTEGPMDGWVAQWANDTLSVAKDEPFKGLTFGARITSGTSRGKWEIHFADRDGYVEERQKIQRKQIEKAGARLTQLLVAIWPD